MHQERLQCMQDWLTKTLTSPFKNITPLVNDASFRRYFRVQSEDTQYVVMDAPPEKENCKPFVAIAKTFHQLGLNVPVIHAENYQEGFLLLSDLGDQLYLKHLNEKTAPQLYQRAWQDLLLLQSCRQIENYDLPPFDEAMYRREMNLFPEWYLEKHLGVSLSSKEQEVLERSFQLLTADALAQPQVCVHRDYHSRNLMVVEGSTQPGILDFQDAVWGPVTYDLLSLLRDCYIDWPMDQVENWVLQFQRQALEKGILSEDNPQEFLRWFYWIGLQRHLKCIGIFARLNARDGKSLYLQYIPRVIRYAVDVCHRYPELVELKILLEKKGVAS